MNDAGLPIPSSVAMAEAHGRIRSESPESLKTLLEQGIESEDFRWASQLSKHIMSVEEFDRLQIRIEESRQIARKRSEVEMETAQTTMEQAFVDEAISSTERAELVSRLEELSRQLRSDTTNFVQWHEELGSVRADLDVKRKEGLNGIQKRWGDVSAQLSKLLVTEQLTRLTKYMVQAFDSRSLALGEEIIAAAERALGQGNPKPVLDLFHEREDSDQDKLALFIGERDKLHQLLSQHNVAQVAQRFHDGSPTDNIVPLDVPEDRYEEVAKALGAWDNLKGRARLNSNDDKRIVGSQVATILTYLGFRLAKIASAAVQPVRSERDWSQWAASIAESDAPVQHFGSDGKGRLDILCIQGCPGPGALNAILKEAELLTKPVLVYYLGEIKRESWVALARLAARSGSQTLSLDEALLLFLAKEHEQRLSTFFKCALPLARINPYVVGVGGNVPSEMFFGRDRHIQALQDPRGPAIVHGGRQLGKSSLLKEVLRGFHKPKRGQYCVIDDIKVVGDIGGLQQEPRAVWRIILERLKETGVLGQTKATSPERLMQLLEKAFIDDSRLRVLVLLDEADNYIRADAADGFKILNEIKRLMDRTDRRFKVVFCGLQHVGRFGAVPNQPLAHLGEPLAIGPLEAQDARDLIMTPFESLGFRFHDEAPVLRILAMTNYHPALIQLVCHRLLERGYKTRKGAPPYPITLSDVEAIRDERLIQDISQRFQWTLNLDPHYDVLVRAMVLDQAEERNGYARGYTVSELRNFASDWWPKGFENVSSSEFRAILRELGSLSVLSSAGEGLYRLRSPNLARLLGTVNDLATELKPYASGEREDDEHGDTIKLIHPALRVTPPMHSPLTQGQIGLLGVGETGVTLVSGSSATGLDQLGDTLKALTTLDGARSFRLVSSKGTKPLLRTLEQLLSRDKKKKPDEEGLVLFVLVRGDDPSVALQVDGAITLIHSQKLPREQWLRLVIYMDPVAVGNWMDIDTVEREEIESRLSNVILDRWQSRAVGRWMDDLDIPSVETDLVTVVTGGYHMLLQEFYLQYQKATSRGPGEATRVMQEILATNGSGLREDLIKAFGLGPLGKDELFRSLCEILGPGEEVAEDVILEMGLDLSSSDIEIFVRVGLLDRDGGKIRMEPLAHAVHSSK